MIWKCGKHHQLDLSTHGAIMGILNVTPDSFSDGGLFDDIPSAREHALQMIRDGAAIIDVGGESTRPGAKPVDAATEIKRVLPVIEAILTAAPTTLLSIDTSKASVARVACEAGVAIINDVTGLRGDPEMIDVAAESKAGVVIMHSRGTAQTMQDQTNYEDIILEVRTFFQQQIQQSLDAGIDKQAIALDPGIGFAKTDEHNLTLLRHLPELVIDPHPLLIGISRKSFIGRLLKQTDPAERSNASLSLTSLTRTLGAQIHRVHDVQANLDALLIAEALLPSN